MVVRSAQRLCRLQQLGSSETRNQSSKHVLCLIVESPQDLALRLVQIVACYERGLHCYEVMRHTKLLQWLALMKWQDTFRRPELQITASESG